MDGWDGRMVSSLLQLLYRIAVCCAEASLRVLRVCAMAQREVTSDRCSLTLP